MSRNAPQLPLNAATPNSISVVSSAGFAAGELIYFNNGDYGTVPNNAFSTDTFNVSTPVPASYYAGIGGYTQTANTTGCTNGIYAQKLSNGNFVNVFIRQSGSQPAFKIVDSTGTVVVAETTISTSFPTYTAGNISVAALAGGGFAVAWVNPSGNITYAVYDNTGAVVLAPTADSFANLSSTVILPSILALPNGGFVIAVVPPSADAQYRIFTATGTSIYSWTAAGLPATNQNPGAHLAARSDSSFIIASTNTGNAASYAVISATNTVIVSGTNISITAGGRTVDVTCLADGTTFVIAYTAYNNTTALYGPAYRLLPASNVLGPEFAALTPLGNTSNVSTSVNVLGLASGNFMITFGANSNFIQYAFFNSAGTCISGTDGTGTVIPRTLPGSYVHQYTNVTLVENTTNIDLYFSNANASEVGYFQQVCNVNKTTFTAVPTGSSTTLTLGAPSLAVNGYAKSGSSPTKAAFLAAASSNPTLSSSIGYSVSPTVISSAAALGCNSTVLTNGNFVVVYAAAATGVITAAIYSPGGSLLSSFSPGTLYTTSYNNAVKVTALTSGKFVIVYNITNTSTLRHQVYSSSGALLNSLTFDYAGYSFGISNANNFAIAGIANDRYALVGTNSYYWVYDSTATVFYGPASVLSGSMDGASVTATPNGGFIFGGYYSSYGSQYNHVVGYNGVSSYNNRYNTTTGGSSVIYGGCSTYAGVQGNINFVLNSPGGSSVQGLCSTNSSTNITSSNFSGDANTDGSKGVGATAIGNVVIIYASVSGTLVTMASLPASTWGSGVAPPTGFSTTLTGVTANTGVAGRASFTINPINGGSSVLFTWCDSTARPSFAIINTWPISGSTAVVAGVTPSNGVPLSVATGYVFTGVSSSSASAGGVGQVQINGSAQLNSSYSASLAYQAFDFQNPGVLGVRGTIVGRNVNLQGNN